MIGDKIKVLIYYIISVIFSVACAIGLHISVKNSFDDSKKVMEDSRVFVNINSVHLASITALKELFIDEEDYGTFVRPYLINTLNELEETLDLTSY